MGVFLLPRFCVFALAGILLIALLLARRVPVKPKIAVGIYLGLIVLYFILHHFAAGSFVLDNGKQLEYSVVSEFFLCMPAYASGSPDFLSLIISKFR